MSEFFGQGGYAEYVWPAYAISAVALIWLSAWSLGAYSKARARLASLEEARDER